MLANFALLRLVAWVKRGVAALESIAKSQQELVAIERQRTPARRPIAKMDLGVADFTETERLWKEQNPHAAVED